MCFEQPADELPFTHCFAVEKSLRDVAAELAQYFISQVGFMPLAKISTLWRVDGQLPG